MALRCAWLKYEIILRQTTLNWNKRDFLTTTIFWMKSDTCSHKTSLSHFHYMILCSWMPCSKLTWQQKMGLVKMYLLLKMEDFNCHVSSPGGTPFDLPKTNWLPFLQCNHPINPTPPRGSPRWSPAPSTTAEQPALRTPKRSPTVPLKKTFWKPGQLTGFKRSQLAAIERTRRSKKKQQWIKLYQVTVGYLSCIPKKIYDYLFILT